MPGFLIPDLHLWNLIDETKYKFGIRIDQIVINSNTKKTSGLKMQNK